MRSRSHAPPPRRRGLGRRLGRGLLVGTILLLAYIGALHLTRGTAVRHVRTVGLDGQPIAVADAAFLSNVTTLTGAVLSPGHRVQLALNGDGTYEQMWADLAAAQRSITLQVYYGNSGRMAGRLRDILVDRARQGVQVLVLYDAFGTSALSDEFLRVVRDAGVRIEPFRPLELSSLHLVQNRSHVRGVVVDGRVGWTGGFGIDDKWLGDGRTNGSWRETNVRFEGPAVRQMQAAFAVAWAEATGTLLTGPATAVADGDGVTAGLLYTSPTPPGLSTSPRPTSRRTRHWSRCSPEQPDAVWTSVCSRPATPPTCTSCVLPDGPGTTRCSTRGFTSTNGSRPRSIRRRSSWTASGRRWAR
jgi:phosphatidylserine/phosphatidylglycerophosphate/cardiolipin synthase-like enzyme